MLAATLNASDGVSRKQDAWHLLLDKFSYALDQSSEAKTDALRRVKSAYGRARAGVLAEACAARNAWLDALILQTGARCRVVELVNISSLLLHLGRGSVLENVGICCDRTTGLPIIPGTTVKGLVSTWAYWEEHGGPPPEIGAMTRNDMRSLANLVLGDDASTGSTAAGQVVFLGGFPTGVPEMELDIVTPHHDDEGRPKSPIPNSFLAWRKRTTWRFPLLVRQGADGADELLNQAELWLVEAATQCGLGAKTAAGYGRFRLKDSGAAPSKLGLSYNLPTKEVKLRLLTPCWCGGSAPEGEAELRLSSLRGQWRWWLRLLHPGSRLDEEILGTCARGTARASKLAFALKQDLGNGPSTDWDGYRQGENDPEGYFLWPLQTKRHGAFVPQGKPPLFSFDCVELAPLTSEERNAWDNALKAWTLLGSFGMRSSRGYGCVWPDGLKFETVDEFKAQLNFLPDTISVRLLNIQEDKPRAALGEAAKWWRSFRAGISAFGASAMKWGQNDHDVGAKPSPQPSDRVFRPALGLPLVQKYRQSGSEVKTTINSKDRWPSPIHLRIVPIAGKYRVVVVIFRELLPDPTTASVDLNGHPVTLSLDLVDHIARQGAQIR